jgi:ABC-type multidrug transport system fused ATPase/permease subunit
MEQVIGLIVGLIIGMVLLAIVTLIFRWLWNSTVPDVFGASAVDFWQAFKIMLLAAMLFGGGTTVIERGHEVVPDEEIVGQAP